MIDFSKIEMIAFGAELTCPPGEKERFDARQLCLQAKQLCQQGSCDEAVELFLSSLRIAPLESEAIGGLAYALSRIGHGEKALTLLDKAEAYDDSRSAEISFSRGRCLKELGRVAQAAQEFEVAQGLDSRNPLISFEAGLCQVQLGQDEPALRFFDAVLKLDADHASCWFERGDCLRRLGRLPEALSCLERSLALVPESASAWFCEGQVLEALGGGPEAGSCYAKFVALAPAEQAEKLFLARQKVAELGTEPA